MLNALILASADDARLLIATGLADRCVRLLIEPVLERRRFVSRGISCLAYTSS